MRERGDDPEKLGPLYGELINAAMSDIPVRHDDHDASVPRQLQIDLHGRRRLRAEAEVLFNQINVHGYFMEYDTERAGGFEPLRLVPKGKQVVLGLVTTKTGKLESKDDAQTPHRRGGEIRRRSTSSACRRNAASPRPRRATC